MGIHTLGTLSGRGKWVKVRQFLMKFLSKRGDGGGIALPGMEGRQTRRRGASNKQQKPRCC